MGIPKKHKEKTKVFSTAADCIGEAT